MKLRQVAANLGFDARRHRVGVRQGGALRKPVLRPLWGSGDAKLGLSRRARLLLWDFTRGSLAYDLLCLLILVLLLLVPVAWWRDPMRMVP